MKLRDKVILTCLLTALFSVTAASLLSLVITNSHVQDEARTNLAAVSHKKAEQILRWTSESAKQLELLARMPIISDTLTTELAQAKKENRPADPELLDTIIDKHLRSALSLGSFSELFLLHVPDGTTMASTNPSQVGKVQREQNYFIKGQQSLHIQNIFYSMSIRQPTMVISLPLRGSDNDTNGVLAGRLNLATLSDILREFKGLWQSEDSYLVNNQHIFITEPRFGKNYMLRKTIYSTGVNQAIAKKNGVALYRGYRGVEVMGAYQYLAEHDLALITEVDSTDYMAPIIELRQSLYLAAACITAMALLIGWLAARAIVAPLTALISAINSVSGSNLELKFDIKSPGQELATIVNAFQKMMSRLKTTLVSREQLQAEIEQRKVAEQDLRIALKHVTRSNAELEQFAYVASHDLQEPLRMVASYNQLLAERYGPQLDERAHKYIHYAVDGSHRMQRLIQDLLTYSRVTTRGAEFEPVDFHQIVLEVMHNLELRIRESGAQITAANLPMVSGDPGQLMQLMQNLLANSIKFKQEAVAPVIHIEAQLQQQEYLFSVHDNGIGIDSKYRDKIFVVFQRLHTREEYPGTGIGLAVCKRIVERHGGNIWFSSEPGRGTTFYFTLKPAAS